MESYALIETEYVDAHVAWVPEYILGIDCWLHYDDARVAFIFLGLGFQIDVRWPWAKDED